MLVGPRIWVQRAAIASRWYGWPLPARLDGADARDAFNELRMPSIHGRRPGTHSDGLGKPEVPWRIYNSPYRTQEVAGSSPASSTSNRC
jgi:hypothetical protein